MVVVLALDEARSAQQGHVVGTKVLEGTAVGGAALHPQLIQGLHHSVRLEWLLLLVPLKVPGAQRHLALQAGLHGQQPLIYAVVAEHLSPLRLGVRLPVQLRHAGSEALDDAAEFEVPLQGFHPLELLTALWASRRCSVFRVCGAPDAGSAVVVSTGENHRIRVELEADGAAQLMG